MDKIALKALYGTDDTKQIIKNKTTGKQTKAFSPRKPKLVEMTANECKILCKAAGLDYLAGYEGRVVEHVITDETVDRYGDIVRAAGVDFKTNYKKNPTIQYAHDYQHPPIGKSIKIWYDKDEANVKSWGLFFDDRVDKTDLSDTIFKFVASGAMPANSVGFNPIKTHNPSSKEDRAKLGLGDYGIEFVKCDLLEYSPCSIGANPNALQNCLKDMGLNKKNFDIVKKYDLVPNDMFDEIIELITEGNDPEFDINEKLMESIESVRDLCTKTIESNTKTIESNDAVIEKVTEISDKINALNITLKPEPETIPPAGGELESDKAKGLFSEIFK